MQIEFKDIKPGDVILCKRGKQDKIGTILSLLLKIFYPHWDMYGWHLAVVTAPRDNDWVVIEASWPVVRLNRLSEMGEYRAYRWLDKQPECWMVERFVESHLDLPYDVKKYIWTFIAGILSKRFHINIGRWDDENYYCWELAEEFVECMGKPFTTKNETLLLPDIQKLLEQ